MMCEQHEVLDESIVKMRAGRMTRRTFFERTRNIGLTAAAASSLLESCSATGNTSHNTMDSVVTIRWKSQHDDHVGTYARLVNDFNADPQYNGKIYVHYENSPFLNGDQYAITKQHLQDHDGSMDVLSLDVIWPAEFASKRWLVKLDDKMTEVPTNHTASVLDSCKYNGHYYAVPLRADLGLLYYRTDLIGKPPETWDELVDMALSRKTLDGYVWQGRKYEGLVCDCLELFAGYGVSLLDKSDYTKVTLSDNIPEAVSALKQMVSWVGTISPNDIISYMEPDARVRWQNGFATFMRNWYDVNSLVRDSSMSSVYNTFNFTPIPSHNPDKGGSSCTGGWLLAINAFSPPARQEAAWQFIKYILNNPAMQSFDQTNAEADPGVKPFFSQTVSRPGIPNYVDLSSSVQKHVFAALQKQITPLQAIQKLEDDLKKIASNLKSYYLKNS